MQERRESIYEWWSTEKCNHCNSRSLVGCLPACPQKESTETAIILTFCCMSDPRAGSAWWRKEMRWEGGWKAGEEAIALLKLVACISWFKLPCQTMKHTHRRLLLRITRQWKILLLNKGWGCFYCSNLFLDF